LNTLLTLAADPAAWAALAALVVMEVVLGIDNLIFISILTNTLPEAQRARARRIGIALALVLRLALLGTIAWIVQLTAPLVTLFGNELSARDFILIAGGLFLVWKATREIHERVDSDTGLEVAVTRGLPTFASVIGQILVLDMVFSLDSIITAVGMTDHIAIMVVAVLAAVAAMMLAAEPLARFINDNPSILMLALGFLLLIGTTLVADGLGAHVPKGYIYMAMAFSAGVEALNLLARRARRKRRGRQSDKLPASSVDPDTH
jgi:predicted tellurium resistance membrane protein TerC